MFFFLLRLSDKTMSNPPMTDKLRRKKLMSKMRPYPKPCTTTTLSRAPTLISGNLRAITAPEAASIT